VQIHLIEHDQVRRISYGELEGRARAVAAGLRARGLEPGETVAIMLPTCADFFFAFFGVTLAGGIAVPIYPPARLNQIEEYVRRQLGILGNAGVRFLISFAEAKPVSELFRAGLPSLIDVVSTGELAAGQDRLAAPTPPDEVFFIQYTSGSTGNPKGVTLTHANVLANVRGIGWAVQARPDDIVVSWLPLYHDMGLIGSWLFSVYHGFPITVMSPLDFLQRPERWLWAMSDSGGSLCPAPNFSYELCVRKIEHGAIEGVDLSRWRIAINAGEPVIPATLRAFTKRFEEYGFDPRAWVPCYGLAESSVALTFPPIDREPVFDRIRREEFETNGFAVPAADDYPDRTLEFVANGVALPEHQIKVVDDAGRPVEERQRGRILFRGPSRTDGYFRNAEATAAAIDAEGWMDSGDLGYLSNGEIFVTGRLKDCIIKSGHNIIPQDVENAAGEVTGVRKGCIAAFGSIDDKTGTEQLIVVAETRIHDSEERRRMRQEITANVARKVGVPPDLVVLAPPQAVPKTSSGKIRRNETRTLWLNGRLGRDKGKPWVQIARLWVGGGAGWTRSKSRGLGRAVLRGVGEGYRHSLWAAVGLLARLSPSRRLARGMAATILRFTTGMRGEGELPKAPALLLLNRSDPAWDLAKLTAAADHTVLVAEDNLIEAAPGALGFLLEPLLLPQEPPLKDRIRRALERGDSVAVFSATAPGEPAARCRFRLEALEAALEAGAPVVPGWIDARREALRWGPPVAPDADLRGWRKRIRAALAELQP
jgi:acyl-CoA synthetase (AMP-forming)/AMP-acid ligase II